MKEPKIIIKYNRFLDPIFIGYIKSLPQWKDWQVPSSEEVLRRIEEYKKEWKKNEKIILNALCEITDLEFFRNVIDVYIVSGNPRQFSNPIVIKSGFEPLEFVITLTHELVHKLFSDNNKIVPELLSLFPKETPTTANHVVIHAILKYLYLDVLNNEKLFQKNITMSKGHSTNDYQRAWIIVEEKGYKNIIKTFKEIYKKSPPSLL